MSMPEFLINDSLGFEENISTFLDHLAEEDEEMTAILQSNIAFLKGVLSGDDRDTARAGFNNSVVTALERLLRETREEQ